MKLIIRYVFLCLIVTFAINGCGLIEPETSKENPNNAPETEIVASPLSGSSFSYFTKISWVGRDNDGYVRSYMVAVDGGVEFQTTISDSTFKFSAANQDEMHSIRVAAVDDDGAIDPTPAEVSFSATNIAPQTSISLDDNPREGSTFGRAQKFYLNVEDPDNGTEFSYRFKLDDGAWSDWLNNSIVEFYEGSPFGLLDYGTHTFYAQARDAALAIDLTPASFSFVVSENAKPLAVLTSTFNSHAFYADNSAYFFVNDSNNVRFSWVVDASAYFGHYAAAKIKIDNNDWSNWLSIQDTLFANLQAGDHSFILKVKDTGGIESDEVSFAFKMVQPTFNAGILVVDEVNGRFAKEADADNFYTQLLTNLGVTFTLWDVRTQGNPTPGNGFGNYSTVIWEADESFMVVLPSQIQLVQEYLQAGGNIWISGWKPIQQLTNVTPVASFDPAGTADQVFQYNFIWNYLKLASTRQSPGSPPDFIGATGLAGHPNINVDAAKNFAPTFANKLATIDMFTVRSEANVTPIYSFVSASGNPDYQDQITGMKYLGDDFKVVVFGFPFFYVKNDEALAAARVILTDLGEI